MPARVLIVDDFDAIRTMLRMRLQHEGCSVVGEAVHGREAVDQVDVLEPDVVIMDLEMPVMDGIEATRTIVRRHPQVRVVGYTSSTPRAEALMVEAGAVASFEKNRFKDLVAFVKSLATRGNF